MFTGIIEELGEIKEIATQFGFRQIKIKADRILNDLKLRDSIAVNGVCLTSVDRQVNSFTVDIIKETLKKTNLGKIKRGDKVNLERATRLGERLGGHIVLGHVDSLAKIVKKHTIGKDSLIWLKTDLEFFKQIVEHGSVALDGVSLTVAEIKANLFKVALIPYTMKETTLGEKKIGDELNLELDYLGKYIQKFMVPEKR